MEPLAPRPATGVHDAADLFSEDQERGLVAELRTALETHRLEVYVATYRLVKGESIGERAARLRNAWARNPFAMVLVYDETVEQMSLVGTRDLERFVDSQQLSGVFQRAAAVARDYIKSRRDVQEKPDPGVMLQQAVAAVLHDPILTDRMTLPKAFHFSRPMFGLLGLFVFAAVLAGVVVVWLERRSSRKRQVDRRCSYFPTTHMALRLGAPYSGGRGISLGEETAARTFERMV